MIKQIQQICGCFLWKGKVDLEQEAKVKWADICVPRSKGGLGLADLSILELCLCFKELMVDFDQCGIIMGGMDL